MLSPGLECVSAEEASQVIWFWIPPSLAWGSRTNEMHGEGLAAMIKVEVNRHLESFVRYFACMIAKDLLLVEKMLMVVG